MLPVLFALLAPALATCPTITPRTCYTMASVADNPGLFEFECADETAPFGGKMFDAYYYSVDEDDWTAIGAAIDDPDRTVWIHAVVDVEMTESNTSTDFATGAIPFEYCPTGVCYGPPSVWSCEHIFDGDSDITGTQHRCKTIPTGDDEEDLSVLIGYQMWAFTDSADPYCPAASDHDDGCDTASNTSVSFDSYVEICAED